MISDKEAASINCQVSADEFPVPAPYSAFNCGVRQVEKLEERRDMKGEDESNEEVLKGNCYQISADSLYVSADVSAQSK